jgi:FAD/FMN-containing dehydrogenase
MSHIVTIRTEVRDPAALLAACSRLGLPVPVRGRARLFSGEAEGLIVQLPGWQYPVVVDIGERKVHYDNYGGAWGAQRELDRLLQAYAVEKARIEARKAGHTVTEQALPDGSIKLTIRMGGAA